MVLIECMISLNHGGLTFKVNFRASATFFELLRPCFELIQPCRITRILLHMWIFVFLILDFRTWNKRKRSSKSRCWYFIDLRTKRQQVENIIQWMCYTRGRVLVQTSLDYLLVRWIYGNFWLLSSSLPSGRFAKPPYWNWIKIKRIAKRI